LPEYETRDGKNYIVRDENGEVQYTRNADFFFSMYEEENGVIDKNISLSSVLMGDNGEYFYFTYKMKLYAVIDWSQIEEGTSAVFNPKNILDAAYEINNSPQIKEYIEEKESYLPIKVDAKATLNLTSSNRIMLYGASMCSNSYPWFKEWLEKYTGAEVFNAGNPGWSAKRVASTTYYDKVAQINPDVIYIMLGGNDKGDDVGTFGAISTQTLVEEIPLTESWSDAEANDKDYKFIQSLDYILRKLKSEYYDINDNPKDDKRFPYIVVGTFTPQHREGYSMIEYNDPQNWLNKRNAIVECANKNNIPCLDVFSNIGIDWDEEPYYNQALDYVNGAPTLANRGIYTLDGLHLNEYGFERLARLVSGVFVPSNSAWKELKQTANLNQISDAELKNYTENGYYEGVIFEGLVFSDSTMAQFLGEIKQTTGSASIPNGSLFSMEVFNNYAVVQKAEQMGLRISQSIVQRAKVLIVNGTYVEIQRTLQNDVWGNWKMINI
jgi:lysophospholipase L1-like esterase